MIHRLSTLLLAPVFIAQGRYVRRVTPRLPEPAGARSGAVGSGPRIRLLIIGDSAAAGVGVDTQKQALSGQLMSRLGAAHEVAWQLIAQTGDASADVVRRLERLSEQAFDFVLVSVGVNDVTARTSSKQWTDNLRKILSLLKTRFQAGHILLSSVPPMHRFPALPQPLRWWLGARAKKLNRIMQGIAQEDAACRFVSVVFPSDKIYAATDGFHPGAPAYALWADHVAKIIQSELKVVTTAPLP